MPQRRHLLQALALSPLAAALPLSLSSTAHAQEAWPGDKPVRLIVPYAAGGFADTHARARSPTRWAAHWASRSSWTTNLVVAA